MAVPDNRVDATPADQKTPRQVSIRTGLSPTVEKMFGALVDGTDPLTGLSPTVEKMFGALVDGTDQEREEYVAEPEGKRAERLSSP